MHCLKRVRFVIVRADLIFLSFDSVVLYSVSMLVIIYHVHCIGK